MQLEAGWQHSASLFLQYRKTSLYNPTFSAIIHSIILLWYKKFQNGFHNILDMQYLFYYNIL